MESGKTTERASKSANRRGSARLAAVQALYQMDVGGTQIEDVLAEFETFRLGGELDGVQYRDADAAFFRDIVSGVVRDQRDIDPLIHDSLNSGWPLARIDVTLRAILRAATHELKNRADVPAKVVIAEYIEVAKAFFEGDETRIVNGVLDSLARQLRSEEMPAPAGPN